MKIEVVLAIIGVLFAAVFAITVPLEYYRLSGVLLAILGFLLCATAVIASDKRCEPTLSALSEDSYRPLYRRLMRRVMGGALWLFGQERPEEDMRPWHQVVRDTFTYGLLDRAMLFAVAYPLLLLVLFWGTTGRDGSIGDVIVLAAEPEDWKRYVALGGLVIVFELSIFTLQASASQTRFLRSVSILMPLFLGVGILALQLLLDLDAFVFAVAVASALVFTLARALAFILAGIYSLALALALAFTTAGALALTVAGTGALTFTLTFAVALAFAFATAFALAVAFAVQKLHLSGKNAQASLFAVLAPFLAICLLIGFQPWDGVPSEARSIFLFLAVLPLTNALFDAVSYGVTLVLTQVGLRGWAMLCALLDIIAALLLFLLLGAALVVIVAGMHQGAGVPFVDLGGLLAQAGDWRNYWWLYAMLFSTAVPTVFHLAIASFSLQALVPLGARNWICKEIRDAREGDPVSGLIATLSLGMLWFLSLALPLALLSGLTWAAWMHGLESAALFYRDWLLSVAIWMEGI